MFEKAKGWIKDNGAMCCWFLVASLGLGGMFAEYEKRGMRKGVYGAAAWIAENVPEASKLIEEYADNKSKL